MVIMFNWYKCLCGFFTQNTELKQLPNMQNVRAERIQPKFFLDHPKSLKPPQARFLCILPIL